MNAPLLTKWFLRIFIASIAATAAVGMYVVAIPSDDWEYEIKVLLTTATIAGTSICGLACGSCLTRGARMLPTAGLVLSAFAAVLTLAGIWLQPWNRPANWDFWEVYWKITTSIIFYGIACAHLSMLLMANLAGMYRWSYLVAYYLILGLATIMSAGIVFEFFDNEQYWRLTAALSILVAAITLLVPVFHYMSREQLAAAQAEADPLFACEEEIARLKKRLIALENNRRMLLGREVVEP